jgi:tetratricopeptide (TPR) repeat protein
MFNRHSLKLQIKSVVFAGIIIFALALHLSTQVNTNKGMLLLIDFITKNEEPYPVFANLSQSEPMLHKAWMTTASLWTQARWLRSQQDPRALPVYWQALESEAKNRLIAFELGNLYATLGEMDQALMLWRQANSGEFWARQAMVASEAGDQDVALDNVERSLAIAPENLLVRLYAGDIFFRYGLMAEAVGAYTHFIEGYQLEDLHLHRALTNRARARSAVQGDWILSEQDLLRALSLQPRNSWTHIRLCELYRDVGRLEQALESCLESVNQDPNSASAYYYLGRVYYAQHKFVLASTAFETALNLDPTFETAQRWLARAQEQQ